MPDDQTTMNNHLTSGESLLVEAFAKNHGEGHVLLACHVAFPMVLTADLVYKIWQNFRSYVNEAGERCEIPYVAVSDLLLSPLCQPSGYQRFEMPANIRHTLLAVFQEDERFGKARLHELASFLKHYIEAAYRDADAIGQAIRSAQQLVVDAWLQPEKALQTLTQAFREAEQSPAEQVRLSNLVARFDLQWEAGLLAQDRQKPKQTGALLQYSQGLSAFHKTGDAYHAADLLKGVVQKGGSGMMLPLPGKVKTTVSNRLSLPKKGKLHALLVAIDEYHPESKISPLRGCKNDARKLVAWLERQHRSADSPWSEVSINTLFDEQATLSILEKRAEVLQNVEAEDQVLIYFAGHARQDKPGDETDLICYDSLLANMPMLTVSRFRNLVSSNARQRPYITVILDAQFTGSPNWLDPMNPKHVVFANTGLSEMGYEISGGEGFFTKYFIEALEQGSRDAGNAALFVDTLAGMAQDKLGEQQHPQFYATPLGADRPFLQALSPAHELKRLLRFCGASLADLRKRLALSDSATKQQWKSALTTFLTEKEKADAPLFLFVFSDANGHLPGVQEERDQLKPLIEAQLQNTSVEVVFLENPDFEEVQQYFTAQEYRNRLHLFHFSGLDHETKPFYDPLIKKSHRKAAPIQQQSNIGSMSNISDEPERPAEYGFLLADGLLPFFEFAPWLQYQQNLRLAFFNSCFSNQTATWATQLGAWNAIGVEGKVSDATASKFAVAFYSKWLVKGNALSAAFSEVLEAFGTGSEPSGGAHRSAREEVTQAPENLPFQLKSAAWLTTGWRGERFTDYYRIADSGLRALVFEYDTLDLADKRERVTRKAQLAQKIGEVMNSVVTDKRVLLRPRSSQGLLAGIASSIHQRPMETDAALLLELVPMVKHLFVKYKWVEAADGLRKEGMWPEERKMELEEVLKGFEQGADEALRWRIAQFKQPIVESQTIIILTPIPPEHDAILAYLSSRTERIVEGSRYISGFYQGKYGGINIVTQLTGPGNTTIALATANAIRRFQPKVVILAGVAGGIKDVEIGDVVVGTKFYGYEYGGEQERQPRFTIRALNGSYSRDLLITAQFVAESGLWQKRAANTSLNAKVALGPIASGDRVIATKDEAIATLLRQSFNDITAVEMESSGFGQAMQLNPEIRFINIRGISDLLVGKAQADAGYSQERAVKNMAAFTFEFIYQLNPENLKIEVDEPEMFLIRGGSFPMGWLEGRDGARNDHEIPTHEVQLNDFYIGKYLVTQAQWRTVMGENPSHFKDDEQCPVEQVSWDDVQLFLKTLNKKTGKNYRLPTEAEWEYAARGGAASKMTEYAGSNKVEEVAWYAENAGNKSQPVGQKKSNELGLYDMSGNVWEWVEDDWHKNYEGAPPDGSAWINSPERTPNKVCRGGSWNYQPEFARCALRYNFVSTHRINYLGFRLAHDAENF
ncbi:MAG: SUMF1/EgtB/PvdO family nonheme iron enzyme [Saprospiraceae bacterium]